MKKSHFEQSQNEIEPRIWPLVIALNEKGFNTFSSCAGHPHYEHFGDYDTLDTFVFSTPFVAFINRIYGKKYAKDPTNGLPRWNQIARAINKAIPDLERCIQNYNKNARTPWMLEPSGWGEGFIDTLTPDVLPANGYYNEDGRTVIEGDYDAMMEMARDVVDFSKYIREKLQAI